jgi:hypothetical protein
VLLFSRTATSFFDVAGFPAAFAMIAFLTLEI